MTKNDVTKYTEQEKMLQESGMMDEPAYAPDVLTLPIIKIKTDKVKGKSEYYLDDGGSITDLPASLEVIPVMAQKIRAMFAEGEDMPVCAGINGRPRIVNPKAHRCDECKYGEFGGLCKPKIRLFCMYRTASGNNWDAALFLLPPTSIKHWDRYVSRLSRNRPNPLKHFQVAAKVGLVFIDKKYKWDEVLWGDILPISDADLAKVIALHHQIKPMSQDVSTADYSEPGDTGRTDKEYDNTHGVPPFKPKADDQGGDDLGF